MYQLQKLLANLSRVNLSESRATKSTQSFAYALTGNIWLSSGLHAGANLASFFPTGLWHAGAIVALVGNVPIPHLLMVMSLLVVLATVFVIRTTRTRRKDWQSVAD